MTTGLLSPRAQLLVRLLGTHRRELQSRACTGCDWRAPAGTTNTRDPDQTRARHETFNTHLALIADAELDRLACQCVAYTIRTDYGTGTEHDVDPSSCPVHVDATPDDPPPGC